MDPMVAQFRATRSPNHGTSLMFNIVTLFRKNELALDQRIELEAIDWPIKTINNRSKNPEIMENQDSDI